MAKYQKPGSSPLVLIIPLIIAIIVVISAVIVSNTKTQSKSKASYSPTERCVTMCNTNRYVKDKGACALDCPGVVAKTMTCDAFCAENVTAVTHQDTVACRDANSEVNRRICIQSKCVGKPGVGSNGSASYNECVKQKCGNVPCKVFSSIRDCQSSCANWIK